jgi:5-methylcytosine-specific restriction endonuclease McrA
MKDKLDSRYFKAANSLMRIGNIKATYGVSVYALCIHQALRAANKEKYSGKPINFIKENIELIENYIKQNQTKKLKKKSKSVKKYNSFQNVKNDDFLSSYEWRKLRMQALKKYGPVCMCCGDSPKNGAVMNVDHIKPRKLFPSLALDIDNLQILCSPCNHGKGNWDFTDWRENNTGPVDFIESDSKKHI